jgi:hypothetical protein
MHSFIKVGSYTVYSLHGHVSVVEKQNKQIFLSKKNKLHVYNKYGTKLCLFSY